MLVQTLGWQKTQGHFFGKEISQFPSLPMVLSTAGLVDLSLMYWHRDESLGMFAKPLKVALVSQVVGTAAILSLSLQHELGRPEISDGDAVANVVLAIPMSASLVFLFYSGASKISNLECTKKLTSWFQQRVFNVQNNDQYNPMDT
jgi:hypothetical protein